jgi:hypothetical protein
MNILIKIPYNNLNKKEKEEAESLMKRVKKILVENNIIEYRTPSSCDKSFSPVECIPSRHFVD